MCQEKASAEQKNPFNQDSYRYTYLVYRSKQLFEKSKKEEGESFSREESELYHWKTFGYYDSLYIDDKAVTIKEDGTVGRGVSRVTYKDCFAIQYPSAFVGQRLLDKQVFTLIPFPEDGATRSDVLFLPHEGKKPFLGMIMISINMVQDESGDPSAEEGDEPDYLKKLLYYRRRIEALRTKYQDYSSANPPKGRLSKEGLCEYFLSTNCADLCVVVRTDRLEDIYLLTKMIRLHLSLMDGPTADAKKEKPEQKILRYPPKINVITAMSTHLADYDTDGRFNDLNRNMAVDYRLTCNSRDAEEQLLRCCEHLKADMEQDKNDPAMGIYPGERIGGVLGVGHYSIYMPLLAFLDLYFHESCFQKGQTTPLKTLLMNESNVKGGLFQMPEYDISNVRLRFCNNANLFNDHSKNGTPEDQGSVTEPFHPVMNKNWWEIEKVLIQMRRELALYRYQVHFSSYMVKESISMVNDLYYTYNNLLYEGNIHSYVLATQLFALTANVLQSLHRIAKEVKSQQKPDGLRLSELDQILKMFEERLRFWAKEQTMKNYFMSIEPSETAMTGRGSIVEAIDMLVEMINQVVLSINSYNKSLVAYSQQNLNFPNYEIQSKVNIEKYQVAYSAFVQSLCDAFPKEQKPILAYVYLDLSAKDTLAKLCFAQLPLQYQSRRSEKRSAWKQQDSAEEQVAVSVLAIASPNYRRFAHMHHLLPQLCHEIGHHYRSMDRKERNRAVFYYMMEPVARQVADYLVDAASLMGQSGNTEKISAILTESIQTVLLEELYQSAKETGEDLDQTSFSTLDVPFNTYLSEYLNYEKSSFSRFWSGYRELLSQAKMVSDDKLRVCGNELRELKVPWLRAVNIPISALNYCLVKEFRFQTGFAQQAEEIAQKAELQKHPELLWQPVDEEGMQPEEGLYGWQMAVNELLKTERKDQLDAKVLLMICLQLACGICTAYVTNYYLCADKNAASEEYFLANKKFILYLKSITFSLSYYNGSKIKAIPSSVNQMLLIHKALKYAEKLQNESKNMVRYSRKERNLYGHAERCYQVSQGVRNLLYTLTMLFQKRSNEVIGTDAPITTDRIPYVMDKRTSRIGKIRGAVQNRLRNNELNAEVYMKDNVVALLQNSVTFEKWLDNAFRLLKPEQCQREAHSKLKLYNEICADFAMCAALQFSPFGYLAYTVHHFSERPEEDGDLSFSKDRIRIIVSILFESEITGKTAEEREKEYIEPLKKLRRNTNTYQRNILSFCRNVIQKASSFKTNKSVEKAVKDLRTWMELGEREIIAVEELENYTNDQKSEQERISGIHTGTLELFADEGLWRVDQLSQEILRLLHQPDQGGETDSDQAVRYQYLLDCFTDLLSHLRTIKRISNIIPYIADTQSLKSDSYAAGGETLQKHYRELWKQLNDRSEDARNVWIKRCWENETLKRIAEHYNHYYNRPGHDQTDEHKDQTHFILRYYWEGTLRYRCLRQQEYFRNGNHTGTSASDQSSETMKLIADWFRTWQQGSREEIISAATAAE